MTTILAVQGDGWAVVGFDSRITTDTAPRVMTLGAGVSKVSKNGPYLLGAAGDLRAINVLAYAFSPPLPGDDLLGVKLDRFMTSKFIPSLRKCLETQGYAVLAANKDESAAHGSTVLTIINGAIYEIGNDYSWARDSSGVYAAGTGGDYALGSFSTSVRIKRNLETDSSAKEMTAKPYQIDATKQAVRVALNVAGAYDPNTGAPFHVLSQTASRVHSKS